MTAPRTRSGWPVLAGELLGRDLLDWLDERRQVPTYRQPVSWKNIAEELAAVTDGKVPINWDSLRLYYLAHRPNQGDGEVS